MATNDAKVTRESTAPDSRLSGKGWRPGSLNPWTNSVKLSLQAFRKNYTGRRH
jgi:hypothetical protein